MLHSLDVERNGGVAAGRQTESKRGGLARRIHGEYTIVLSAQGGRKQQNYCNSLGEGSRLAGHAVAAIPPHIYLVLEINMLRHARE